MTHVKTRMGAGFSGISCGRFFAHFEPYDKNTTELREQSEKAGRILR
jgi:hypothetical protein